MRILRAAALAFVTLSLPVSSQTDLSNAIPNDLANGCKEAVANGQNARSFVEEMLSRTDIPLGATAAYDATQCIRTVTGEKYRYENGRFLHSSVPTAQEQQAREAAIKRQREKEAEQREQAYIAAVVQICLDEYNRDRFNALTTPICGEIFKARGLPD